MDKLISTATCVSKIKSDILSLKKVSYVLDDKHFMFLNFRMMMIQIIILVFRVFIESNRIPIRVSHPTTGAARGRSRPARENYSDRAYIIYYYYKSRDLQ